MEQRIALTPLNPLRCAPGGLNGLRPKWTGFAGGVRAAREIEGHRLRRAAAITCGILRSELQLSWSGFLPPHPRPAAFSNDIHVMRPGLVFLICCHPPRPCSPSWIVPASCSAVPTGAIPRLSLSPVEILGQQAGPVCLRCWIPVRMLLSSTYSRPPPYRRPHEPSPRAAAPRTYPLGHRLEIIAPCGLMLSPLTPRSVNLLRAAASL